MKILTIMAACAILALPTTAHARSHRGQETVPAPTTLEQVAAFAFPEQASIAKTMAAADDSYDAIHMRIALDVRFGPADRDANGRAVWNANERQGDRSMERAQIKRVVLDRHDGKVFATFEPMRQADAILTASVN